jgi:hypothetical protein
MRKCLSRCSGGCAAPDLPARSVASAESAAESPRSVRRTPRGITRLHPPGPDGSLDGTSRHADSDEGPAGPHSPTALRLNHSTTHHTDAASSAAATVKNDRVSNATTKRGPADYRTWPDRLCERSSRTAVAKAACSPRRTVAARRAAASRTRSVKRPRSRSPVRTTSSRKAPAPRSLASAIRPPPSR